MHASAPIPQHRFSRRKAAWIAVVIFAVLVVGLPTVTLGRLQERILLLLSRELGRPVTAQSVHLVLLPWPGVELDQVQLADAPEFGGEAFATAQQARATVRILALFGGRLEFSSIHLDQANINLTRNAAGRWNLPALLAHVRHAGPHLRPTTARSSWRRAGRFPYLAVQDSRINFKFGLTKQPFYLSGVNASLELAPQGWRFHVQFAPQRSDLSLSNTGVVTADGIWYRPPRAHQARAPSSAEPLSFDLAAHLRGAYLAAASALLLGQDAGVHGVARVDLQIRGTRQQFRLSGTLQARRLHRWDRLPSALHLRVPFAATYDAATDTLRLSRLGGTRLDLQGQIANLLTRPAASLSLTIAQLPSAALLPLARALDPSLPPDLSAQGEWNGHFNLARSAASHWSVQGVVTAAHAQLREGQLRLRLTAPACRSLRRRQIVCAARRARITGPDHADAALSLSARLDRHGARLQLAGDRVTVADLAALGQLCGVAAPWPYQLAGEARLVLHRRLSWTALRGYALPADWEGQAVWRRAQLRFPALGAPIPIQDLLLQLGPSQSLRLHARIALGGSVWRLSIARLQPPAPWTFDLKTRQLSLARFLAALRPQPPRGFLARLFSHPASWLSVVQLLHARGHIAVGVVRWHGHAAALQSQVQADGAVWRFPDVRLRLPAGTLIGHALIRNAALRFTARGQHLNLQRLLAHTAYAQALRGPATLQLQGLILLPAGWTALTAHGRLTVQPGAFPLLRTPAGTWLRFHRYQTRFAWSHGIFRLTHGQVWPTDGAPPDAVAVQLQPPAPPRLEWDPSLRRTALIGAWPAAASPARTSALQTGNLHHERQH